MAATDDDIAALKGILSCVDADGAQHSEAFIEEKQQGAKLKKLKISELQPGMLLLGIDEGRKRANGVACMSPLFADDGKFDQNRACDAVLLKKISDGDYEICYIELKSDSPSGYEGQFKSTQCFMHYVSELFKALCDLEIKFTRERFVVFHTDASGKAMRGKKRRTQFKPCNVNTPACPVKFCVQNSDTIRWSEFF